MNILSLNVSDLGGLSYNLCHAINKYTDHLARSIIYTRSFTFKPFMISRATSKEYCRLEQKWIREADVIHFNEKGTILSKYKVNPKICKNKKIIFHAHGSYFRKYTNRILANYYEAFPHLKIITSTPDLLEYIDPSFTATWFPSIVPIDDYRKKYKRTKNNLPVVYYSPTGSSTKTMKSVIHEVSEELWNEGIEFRLQITTNTPHIENMRMKARADIYYDEIYPSMFYGINAIEAAILEKAVICNMSPYAHQYMERLYGQIEIDCPFLIAQNRNELKHVLRELILNDDHRLGLGEAGLKYVRKMHDEKICIERFMELIEL